MANWSKNKTLPANINSGNEYAVGDDVSLENLNAITNNSFYAMEKAEEAKAESAIAYQEAHSAFLSDNYHPNFLINGDFRVNQRGQNSYTGANSVKYTVDRWAINWSPTITFDATTKTISVTGNGSFVQYIEDTPSLLGKTVTLSAKVDGVIYSGTTTLESSYSADNYILTVSLPHGAISLMYVNSKSSLRVSFSESNFSSNYSVVIDYMKLEIGSVATPFSPRPYAEELEMCKRYYNKLKSLELIGFARNSTTLRATFKYEVEMRTSPTFTQDAVLSAYDMVSYSVTEQSSKNFTQTYTNTKSVMLSFGNFTGLVSGNAHFANNNVDLMSLDAEIY